eukprot:COSAG02_NODE_279_length_25809_cov_21.674173_7_plen_62_part_00
MQAESRRHRSLDTRGGIAEHEQRSEIGSESMACVFPLIPASTSADAPHLCRYYYRKRLALF